MNENETQPQMLHEAPVEKVAPLHHNWKTHYYNEEEEKTDGEEENS